MAHRRVAVTKLILGRVGGRTVVNPGESVDLTDDELRTFERMDPPVIRQPPEVIRHVMVASPTAVDESGGDPGSGGEGSVTTGAGTDARVIGDRVTAGDTGTAAAGASTAELSARSTRGHPPAAEPEDGDGDDNDI